MTRCCLLVAFWTLMTALPLGISAPAVSAQDTEQEFVTPDWGDYPLLMSQFGELCTMCVAYLQCQTDESGETTTKDFALYYFETKTFWGQIAIIWDYFAVWFDPVTSENRPATIYRFAGNDQAKIKVPTTAYLSEVDAKIEIDNTWIDRDTSDWYALSGERIGSCRRLGIPESVHMITSNEPWMEQTEQVAAR